LRRNIIILIVIYIIWWIQLLIAPDCSKNAKDKSFGKTTYKTLIAENELTSLPEL
jgi:hypothetical protein